jgi:hypothetical protein
MITTMRILILVCWCLSIVASEYSNVPDAASAPWVRENEVFSADIALRNPYDRAVKVVKLDSTCECSRLELDERFLLPGASTVMHLSSKNANRSGEQKVSVSLYLSDPELEPIEVVARWNVRAAVLVDAIPPGKDPLPRPTDRAWQDIYRYVSKERPDELGRLRKRIRLASPEQEVPAGGLKVLGIDYPGTLWKFVPTTQADGSILITATARDPETEAKPGTYDEKVVVRTNHPDKAAITLRFLAIIDRQAGQRAVDPFAPGP